MQLARSSPARVLGLGDLALPYPAHVNPLAEAAGERVKLLAREAGVLTPALEPYFDDFNTLSAQFYPHASERGLALGTLLISWLFFLDDSYDRDAAFAGDVERVRALMKGCLQALTTGTLGETPCSLQRYSLALGAHLSHGTDGDWMERFSRSVEDYLLRGSLQVVEGWSRAQVPDLDTYMERRIFDSGVLPCVDLLEPLGGYLLPARVLCDPGILELRRLCARVIAFANDIVSYEQEVIARDKPNNLVRLVMERDGLSFESGVTACVELVNRDARIFSRVSARLPRWGGPVDGWLAHYVAGMGSLMRGNLDWSLASRRYTSPTSPFPELRRA